MTVERYGSATRARWIAALTIGALIVTQFAALRRSDAALARLHVAATREGHLAIIVSLAIAAVGLLAMRPRR